jgi:hypothetical protein
VAALGAISKRRKMQAILNELDVSTLQLLQKVTLKMKLEPLEEKFRLLKRSNEVCQTKVFSSPETCSVLELMGWVTCEEGLRFTGTDEVLDKSLEALEKSIQTKTGKTKEEQEYEERKSLATARAAEIQRKQQMEQERKDLELKKIKSIQSDVKDRIVKASQADPTMGRSSAAIGIFAGAGGRSSSAKTFGDIGVNLNS